MAVNNNRELLKLKNNKKVVKKRLKFRRWISVFLMLIILSIFIYSGYNIVIWFLDNNKTAQIQEEVLDSVTVEEVSEDVSEEEVEMVNEPEDTDDIYYKYQNVSLINVDIEALKNDNSDTVGWLQVMGTDINYPIVQSSDNDYYLKHDFLKNKNTRGWIFLDYLNDLDNLSQNNVIFGHRNSNGTMFGTLKNVLTSSWLNNTDNHVIKVSSSKYNYLFQVFSVYTVDVETYYITTSFATTDEYQKFLDTMVSRSIHNFNTSVNTSDYLLTLSTCTGDGTKRLVVHSKLIKMSEK